MEFTRDTAVVVDRDRKIDAHGTPQHRLAKATAVPRRDRPRAEAPAPSMGARKFLTTRDAAAYCGFTAGALRKAHHDRRVFPAGRRGGTGTCMWSIEDLDRF
ncbi:MAG: hypothetical protein ABI183_20020, partial [Polyangiaceae bacterium]